MTFKFKKQYFWLLPLPALFILFQNATFKSNTSISSPEVFNASEYSAINKVPLIEAKNHWENIGAAACLSGSLNFSVKNYLARYADVSKAFGGTSDQPDCLGAINHYLTYGISEGRKALEVGVSEVGTGCLDGLCLWISGIKLADSIPAQATDENRYQKTYINLYDSKNPSTLVGRYYANQFSYNPNGSLEFALKNSEVESVLQERGLFVQVVQPERNTWSRKFFLGWKRNNLVYKEDFENLNNDENGVLSRSALINKSRLNELTDWFPSYVAKNSRIENAPIHRFSHPDNSVLNTKTPEGFFGPSDGGIAFNRTFFNTPDRKIQNELGKSTPGFERLISSYWVNFSRCENQNADFDFRGGKLPGLAGGNMAVATGGCIQTENGCLDASPNGRNGWSARSMFHRSSSNSNFGTASLYLYHADMFNTNPNYPRQDPQGSWKYGQGFSWKNPNGSDFEFESHNWYRVIQYVKMNSMDNKGTGKFDGEVRISVNGKDVLKLDKVRFRHASLGTEESIPPFNLKKNLDIDTFAFGLWYGGSTKSWAPKNDSCALVDDIMVFEPHR